MAFKIAAAQALKKGLTEGQPVLLEPIVNMTITVPDTTPPVARCVEIGDRHAMAAVLEVWSKASGGALPAELVEEALRRSEGDALIRLLLGGICNTDLEITRGYADFLGVAVPKWFWTDTEDKAHTQFKEKPSARLSSKQGKRPPKKWVSTD